MANLEKKLKKYGLQGKVYKSKKTNEIGGYNHSYGLKTSDDVGSVLGKQGVSNIGSDIRINANKTEQKSGKTEGSQINKPRKLYDDTKVDGLAISTGGGDPFKKGSTDNEFLVAENAEEAEELRERTDGEIPVRTLQYRDEEGHFADSPSEVNKKIGDKARGDKDYFRRASGLSEEEFKERIASVKMTEEEFVTECSRAIDSASRRNIDKAKLMNHLKKNENLKHSQALRIHNDEKYGRKNATRFNKKVSNENYRNFQIKFFQSINENVQKAKRRGPIKRKMRRILKENQEKYLKKQQNQNQNADNFEKVRNEATNVQKGINLSQYSQQEINQAKEEAKKYGGNPNDEMELEYRIKQNRKDRGQ